MIQIVSARDISLQCLSFGSTHPSKNKDDLNDTGPKRNFDLTFYVVCRLQQLGAGQINYSIFQEIPRILFSHLVLQNI